MKPAWRLTRVAVVANVELWGKIVWQEWETLPTDKKLAWFLFMSHTVAVVSLVELFFLKRR